MKKLLLSTLASMMLFAGCTNQKDINATNINGTIYMKGSEPHTYLVIEENKTHKNYQITNPKQFDLISKQNQKLSLKAKVIKESNTPLIPTKIEVLEVQ